MSENEKAILPEDAITPEASSQEALTQSTTSAETEIVATECDTIPAESETVAPVETPESETDADVDAEADEQGDGAPQESGLRRFHDMTKEELLEEMRRIVNENLTSAHKDVAAIKQAFFSIRTREIQQECIDFVDEGNQAEDFSSAPDPLEGELKTLLANFKQMRSNFLEEEETERQNNLILKLKIIDRLKEIVEDIDNINLHFPKFQQLQNDFKAINNIPAGSVNDTWKNYQVVVEQFYDRLKMNKELRDLDFKKNLEIKTALIEQAEKLGEEADVIAAFRSLQALHDEWRRTGPVAKDLRDEIWERFKAASTVVNKRHQDFFERRKAEEQEAEMAKTALCEEIEAIDFSTINTFAGWDETTKKIIDLQQRWRTIGFASRKINNQLFARFRAVCDDFFAKKSDFYRRQREDSAKNIARKTELCEKVEALKEANLSTKAALDEVVRLQAEWKAVGNVPRKQGDELWRRFSQGCNFFFDARKKEYSVIRQAENENLVAKRKIIEELSALPTDGDRNEVMPKVKELQAKWQEIGHVPFKQKDKIYAEYRKICDTIYEAFSMQQQRNRFSKFKNRIAEMDDDNSKLARERDRLVRAAEVKRNELNTYQNNLGFFNIKSKEGNSMVKDMERRIGKIREDIVELEKKIEMLDSKIKES